MIYAPDATPTPAIQGDPGGAGDGSFRADALVSRVLHLNQFPSDLSLLDALDEDV
jgi:hypothetical protein